MGLGKVQRAQYDAVEAREEEVISIEVEAQTGGQQSGAGIVHLRPSALWPQEGGEWSTAGSFSGERQCSCSTGSERHWRTQLLHHQRFQPCCVQPDGNTTCLQAVFVVHILTDAGSLRVEFRSGFAGRGTNDNAGELRRGQRLEHVHVVLGRPVLVVVNNREIAIRHRSRAVSRIRASACVSSLPDQSGCFSFRLDLCPTSASARASARSARLGKHMARLGAVGHARCDQGERRSEPRVRRRAAKSPSK